MVCRWDREWSPPPTPGSPSTNDPRESVSKSPGPHPPPGVFPRCEPQLPIVLPPPAGVSPARLATSASCLVTYTVLLSSWIGPPWLLEQTTTSHVAGHRRYYALTVLEARSLKSASWAAIRRQWDRAPSGGSRGESFFAFSGFWWFPVTPGILGLWAHHSSFCLCLRMVSSSAVKSLSASLI